MLGEAISMLVPQVVGFRLTRRAARGRDRDRPRPDGDRRSCARRAWSGSSSSTSATVSTGCPSPTARRSGTCRRSTARRAASSRSTRRRSTYLRLTGRPAERIALVEAYCKENALWHDPDEEPTYSQVVELDLGDRRAVDRRASPPAGSRAAPRGEGVVPARTRHVRRRLRERHADKAVADTFPASDPVAEDPEMTEHRRAARHVAGRPAGARGDRVDVVIDGETHRLDHGAVVIAAITSCTNTSNPAVMIAAGLLAKRAVERGLSRRPWVKSSLAPGSKVVTEYYDRAGLTTYLEQLGFHTVGYGCTTCIGNSGPLPGRGLGRGDRGRPRRLRRPLRESQLRGAHPSRGEGELPRLAAARRRLRARRPHGPRPDDRAARPGLGRRGRLPARPLAEPARDPGDDDGLDRRARCSAPPTPTSTPATRLGASCRCPRATSSPGRTTRPTSACRRTSTG